MPTFCWFSGLIVHRYFKSDCRCITFDRQAFYLHVISTLVQQVVDLISDEAAKGDEIACNGVEMVREKVEVETDKFVYDEYYADGVVYEDLFGVGSTGSDSDVDFVVREYLDEYSDLRLDFRSETDHC